jgi:predicted aspartyl protease
MGADVMGRVVVEATVENLDDLVLTANGHLQPEEVRAVVLRDALVDTGATTLALPRSAIAELGLKKAFEREGRSSQGLVRYSVYGPVRLTVQGRNCIAEVVEVPDDVPALIGQVPLELMDWVVDPRNQRLIGNPAHGGVQTIELY